MLESQEGGKARIRGKHFLALAPAVRAALTSRSRTFRQLVQDHAGAKPSEAGVDLPALLADLAVWRRISPWLPLDGACLFRSGMLAAFLGTLGHRTTWVFGVRTWPFQAHCWLQVEDVALDDEAERLCAFKPLLGV
ncbi:lasso peptide biosynthesis B2 protein [Caulobacter sp. UC70_42]|uniref:lasso peptide biosynthesis B2 protein n=1 Tax=Caulobacter sp. UC70_42 TaxID=3374551 RepID=UPI0037584C90